jgi:DNA segregation ATPase FtsK/SpoIIIE-like protein
MCYDTGAGQLIHPDRRQRMQEKRLKRRLEIQARQLERAYTRAGLMIEVTGGKVTPDTVSYDLRGRLATSFQHLRAVTGEIGRGLGLPRLLLAGDESEPQVQVASSNPASATLLDLVSRKTELPPATAILGIAEDGRPVVMEFGRHKVTNALISGDSGSGKTTLLRTIAVSLAITNRQSVVQLIIIDAGPAEGSSSYSLLEPLTYLPHVLGPVIYGQDLALDTLSFLAGELAYRLEQEQRAPMIAVLIDNINRLSGRNEAPAAEFLAQLAQHGPEVGLHLVASAREMDVPFFDELLKANMPVRLVGKTTGQRSANLAAGVPGTRAEYLQGSGEFVAVMDGGPAIQFQAASLEDHELHLVLEELHRSRPRPLLAQQTSVRRPSPSQNAAYEMAAQSQRRFAFDGESITLSDEMEDDKAPE